MACKELKYLKMKMYKHILLLILFSILLPGTDGTIRGKVTDEDGTALVGTQIYIPCLLYTSDAADE